MLEPEPPRPACESQLARTLPPMFDGCVVAASTWCGCCRERGAPAQRQVLIMSGMYLCLRCDSGTGTPLPAWADQPGGSA